MGELLTFYLFAGLMIASALVVIRAKSPVYSLLSLLVAMFCLAALFVLLGAVFLAALQILIYAGAVLVLFLFVLMLLNLDPQTVARAKQFTGRKLAWALGVCVCVQLLGLLRAATLAPLDAGHLTGLGAPAAAAPGRGTIAVVGSALFRDALLPFELTSLLILAAIVGAVALAQRHRD